MTRTWQQRARTSLVGAIGAAMIFGIPVLAQADQGKWWTPKQGSRAHGVHGRAHSSAWGGPVRRDFVVVRHGPRGHAYRAHRVYVSPRYHRRAVYVRPVRLYFGANVRIGGVHIRAGNHPYAGYAYGCNFCDTRFGVYGAYATHVARCDARPDGYRVYARDWEGEDWDSGRRERYEDQEWDSGRRERYEDQEWDR